MSTVNHFGRNDVIFILPQTKKTVIGTQGEVAEYIPYRMEDGVTPERILRELRAQEHLAPLAEYISVGRRIYLIESESREVLQLAAEYIGTYHRLEEGTIACVESDIDMDEDREAWENGDTNHREFDFEDNLPYLSEGDLSEVYSSDRGMGFGGSFFRSERSSSRPWWTMSHDAPVAVETYGDLSRLPEFIRAMEARERIILLHHIPKLREGEVDFSAGMWSDAMKLSDLSFELETEMLRLEPPAEGSEYKRRVLRRLARMKGEGFAPSTDLGRILSLITESRGDADNATLSKAVSNAYLRRKTKGRLTARDFEYLSTFRSVSKKKEVKAPEKQTLIGQPSVRRQLERIVDTMTVAKRRRELGLPADEIHYTFAFMGAPGTGKTTWAMHLAAEMKERGLLDNTESICINAAELKAQYVGHTTGKVKALFEQYGVIILDEAYSLAEGEHGDSFGAEALAQLCVELEKHSSDRLVIFAGYGGLSNSEDNRMLRFLQSNPGINSRVSFKIHFDNFEADELVEVFRSMLCAGGYTVPRGCDALVAGFFRERMRDRAFGNCRDARNLADRVKTHAASRLARRVDFTREEAACILDGDVAAAAEEILAEYRGLNRDEKPCIGFGK